jgi:hypothetical protein
MTAIVEPDLAIHAPTGRRLRSIAVGARVEPTAVRLTFRQPSAASVVDGP